MATVENNFSLLNKEQIAAMKAKRLSFNRRKACIRKKTMELSVLCDVNACVFIVDGSEVETWPEKQDDVLKIIKKYKKCRDDVDDNKEDIVVDHQNQNSSSWEDHLIDGLPTESLEEVLRTVDSKLEALDRRIEAVKMAAVNKPNNDNSNKGKDMIITQEPICGKGTFKDEESDICFGNVVLGSSSGMGAAAKAGQRFLNMQAFLQTPCCVQESSNQEPIYGKGNFKDEESDFCFGNVGLGSSSGMGAAAEGEQGFLNMQAFLRTPCLQESSSQEPIYGKGYFKDEKSDFCFGNVALGGSSSGMGAAAEAEQGFLNMQAFLQTPCVQESSNQESKYGKRAFKDEEADFCFGTVVLRGSSSGMGATAEAEQGFLNMQAFLQTPHVQESSNQESIYGKGAFKDEEADLCFGNVVLGGSSSGMGATAEAEQEFLSMQAFLQTPCVQESPNQKQHKSASSEQRFFSYMQPLQMNLFNIQESDQILYYLPHGQ